MVLYQILLKPKVENWNTDKVLLNAKRTGSEKIKIDVPSQQEAIYNVYELPWTKKAIQHLHVAAGFPPNAACIKA